MEVSLEEAAKGLTNTLTVPRRESCAECRGQGGERTHCVMCAGSGQLRQSAGFMVIARTCSRCGGQGSVLTKACSHCRGSGRVSVERKIQVKIPAGIEDGMRLRIGGEGEGGARSRGDLYVLIGVKPHPVFHREGPNLLIEYPVPITQAALGTEAELPTLNGRVSMKIPAGTQSGTVFRVRGKGLPDVQDGRVGDLLVRVVVETPTKLSARQRQLLEEFAKTSPEESYPTRRSFLENIKRVLK